MKFEYWSYDCKSFQVYDLDESAASAYPLAEDKEKEDDES